MLVALFLDTYIVFAPAASNNVGNQSTTCIIWLATLKGFSSKGLQIKAAPLTPPRTPHSNHRLNKCILLVTFPKSIFHPF